MLSMYAWRSDACCAMTLEAAPAPTYTRPSQAETSLGTVPQVSVTDK